MGGLEGNALSDGREGSDHDVVDPVVVERSENVLSRKLRPLQRKDHER